MNNSIQKDDATALEQTIYSYHRRTTHRFEAYAAGPETLDWDAQPSPFRHFEGCQQIALPAFSNISESPELLAAIKAPFHALQNNSPQPLTLASLGALLHLALGITAWKSFGPDRWAVRANPSSGNLHPTEAYVMVAGVRVLADGLYHYRVETHALEKRGEFKSNQTFLHIALTSIMWREAWKYGERAFRYCQLDTGHAIAALSYAAAALGWQVFEQSEITHTQLAETLGTQRLADFPFHRMADTELEEPEVLLSVVVDRKPPQKIEMPVMTAFHGTASPIDKHPMYRWPAIQEIAQATQASIAQSLPRPRRPLSVNKAQLISQKSIGKVILGRRSAQRFDTHYVMPKEIFFSLLAQLQPSEQAPWQSLSTPQHINLIFFIHRVEGLAAGIYLLPSVSRLSQILQSALNHHFQCEPVEGSPLQLLATATPAELHRITRSLHCHQDIAATSCFSIGMLAEFDETIRANPAVYRALYREAGLIGQVLYLQAEAHGLRGTGIGCYFDDSVHELLGLKSDTFKSMYHFTVGLPLEDARIETRSTSIF